LELPKTDLRRICVIHKNIPNTLTQLTNVLSAKNINIENMYNKSKKDNAYSVLEIEGDCPPVISEELMKISGVIRVRII